MYRKVVALVLVAIFLMAISLMAGFMCFPNNLLHAHYRYVSCSALDFYYSCG